MHTPHGFQYHAAVRKRSNNLIHLNYERRPSGACFSFYLFSHTLRSCSSESHLKNKILAPLAKFFNFFHPLFYLICCEYAVLRSVAFCVAGLSCSIGPSVITNLKCVKWGLFLTIFLLRMFSLCLVNCVLWYVILMAVEHLQLPLTPIGAVGLCSSTENQALAVCA